MDRVAPHTRPEPRPRWRLRPFRAGDAEALCALQRAAIAAVPDTVYTAAERASWAEGLEPAGYAASVAAGEAIAVAVSPDGRLLGFCGHRLGAEGVGEICGLYVEPSEQGRGIGQALLASAEATLAERGAGVLRVTSSLSAERFYRARGYRPTGEARHRTRGGLAIAVCHLEKPAADVRPWRNFYGRRQGKKLRPGQQALLETRLAELAPRGIGWEDNPERAPLDLPALFGRDCPVWLEIGFGGGEHMIATAAAHPEIGLIGCEPFINGVAMLLSGIERAGVANLRIHAGDARDLLDVLPEGTLGRVYLLYPDPWPKTRHHKRRFVSAENLDALARAMAPGAELRIATDIGDYVRHSLERIMAHSAFVWTAERPDDWRRPWADWPGTRYEAKALAEGRRPHYLRVHRV